MMRALPTVDRRARRPRHDVRQRVRQLSALLSRAGDPAHRRVRPQPRDQGQQPAQRRRLSRAARPGPHTRRRWLQAAGYQTGFVGKWLNGLRTPQRAPPGWNEWDGLVGEGGEGLSSFYDYDVFEPDGGVAPLRRPAGRLPDRRADPRVRAAVHRRPGGRSRSVLPLARLSPAAQRRRAATTRPGRRCSDGPPASRKGRQSAIPPPRYARGYSTRTRPAPAVVRRARRQRQAEVRSPPSAVATRATWPRSRATTAAGWRRCARSTTPCSGSSSTWGPPPSSPTPCSCSSPTRA